MATTQHVSTRIDREVWRQVRVRALAEGVSAGSLVERWIRAGLDGEFPAGLVVLERQIGQWSATATPRPALGLVVEGPTYQGLDVGHKPDFTYTPDE